MKHLFLMLVLSGYSVFAGADVDAWTGIYKANDGDGTAVISKTLVEDATLFEPAVYEYKIQIQREKDDIERSLTLELDSSGQSLEGYLADDCDNPDCHAFDSLEVTVSTVKGQKQVELEYTGYDTEDGSDEVDYFKGTAVFVKE